MWKNKGVRVEKRPFTPEEQAALQELHDTLSNAYKQLESLDPNCIRAYEKGKKSDLLNCISYGLTLAREASATALVEAALSEFTGPIN